MKSAIPGHGPPPRPPRSDGSRCRPSAPSPPVEPAHHRLYLHLAWATLNGLPLVGSRQALALEGQLVALCRRLDVEPVEVAVAVDRVHLLLRLKPVHAVAEVALRLKRGSTEAAVRRGEPVRWARGWAAATVDPDDARRMKRLLGTQSQVARELTPGLRPP